MLNSALRVDSLRFSADSIPPLTLKTSPIKSLPHSSSSNSPQHIMETSIESITSNIKMTPLDQPYDESHLTVRKTSLFFSGDGFTAYNSKGQLVFRVESYGPDDRNTRELVLMDASGRCLLTVRRKWPSLHQRWEAFLGEKAEGQKPIFSVRRSSIIGRSGTIVEMYTEEGEEYQIEGCFGNRCCTIYNSAKEVMAEIKRKVDASANVVLGKDVFTLCLKAGFDAMVAMGLVLVLDQINGDEEYNNGAADNMNSVTVHPMPED